MEPNRAHERILNLKSQIISISKEDKLAKPIILISGFLLSLWTNCIFLVACSPRGLYSFENYIAFISFVTHCIISIAVTKGVYFGIKNNDRIYLKPWMYFKVIEGILLFTGSILCTTSYGGRYSGLTPVGIILLMLGIYITMCVYTTYKQMISITPPSSNEHSEPEHPPAYDSFTNQKELASACQAAENHAIESNCVNIPPAKIYQCRVAIHCKRNANKTKPKPTEPQPKKLLL